jgi:hypothetical protein
MTTTDEQFEALRAKMKYAVDLYIDNLIDDAREGGLSSDSLPTVADAIEDLAETFDEDAIDDGDTTTTEGGR